MSPTTAATSAAAAADWMPEASTRTTSPKAPTGSTLEGLADWTMWADKVVTF